MTVPYQNNATNPICSHCRCQKVQLWQLLRAIAAGNVKKAATQANNCKATSGSPSFYFSQYSNHPGIYSFNQSVHFSHLFFSLSFLSYLPPDFSSFHFICLSYRLLLFCSCVPVITCLSAQTTACIVPLRLLVLLTEYTVVCLYVYLPSAQAWR